MTLPWDQETEKALRAAQAVLAPADLAWFEAAHASAFLDPAIAMERIFGALLGGDTEPAAHAEPEPEAIGPMRRRESRDAARMPAESTAWPAFSAAPARRIARDPHARPLSIRPHRPVMRDDVSGPVHASDLEMPATAGSVAGAPSKPGTMADTSSEPIARTSVMVPERHATVPDFTHVEDGPGSSAIRRGPVTDDPPAPRGIARATNRHLASGVRAADPERPSPRHAPASATRLITGLSELNDLFRSVVESQSDERPEPQRARPDAQDESEAARPAAPDEFRDATDPQVVIRPDAAERGNARPIDHAHEAAVAPSGAPGRHVAFRVETPAASGHFPLDMLAPFANSASTLPDPTREDVLLDRLLDRFEERLREQAIRHLGFTGGLT